MSGHGTRREEVIIIKPWYTDTAVHMWRYFIPRKGLLAKQIPGVANQTNWFSCWLVYQELSDDERVVLDEYFSCDWRETERTANRIAIRNATPVKNVYETVRRACRLVVERRGLIDPVDGGRRSAVRGEPSG